MFRMLSLVARLVSLILPAVVCATSCGGRDTLAEQGLDRETMTRENDRLASGGQSNSGGNVATSGGSQGSGGDTSSGGGEFAVTGGVNSGGGAAPETGGEGGELTVPDIPDSDVGHVSRSCGGNMWSKDESLFLDCRVGGEHEDHPDCEIVDCTAYGDLEAICVFSNHCLCNEGFACEFAATDSPECPSRESCVPVR